MTGFNNGAAAPVGFTDERRELARTAARLLADAAGKDPLPPAFGSAVRLDRSLWAALAGLGLLGLDLPESLGGAGAELLDVCVLAEQVGAALPVVPFVATVAVARVLARCPGAEQVLGRVLAGERVIVPDWRSWPSAVVPGSRAAPLVVRDGRVGGALGAIGFGLDADQLLAFADDGSVLLVELDGPGVHRAEVNSFDVREPMAEVVLDDVPATVLVPSGSPVAELLTVFAAELVGTGRRALDGAVRYAAERRQFGRPIGSFQAIKHLLADRYVELDAARLLVYAAAAEPSGQAARAALASASAAADAASGDALQVHGGIGFTWEHESHVLLKRVRARRSLLGSPAHHLDAIADLVFGPAEDRPRLP